MCVCVFNRENGAQTLSNRVDILLFWNAKNWRNVLCKQRKQLAFTFHFPWWVVVQDFWNHSPFRPKVRYWLTEHFKFKNIWVGMDTFELYLLFSSRSSLKVAINAYSITFCRYVQTEIYKSYLFLYCSLLLPPTSSCRHCFFPCFFRFHCPIFLAIT